MHPYPGAVLARLRQPVSPETYRRVTVAAVVLLVFIVVTGAGVRLSGSGLGCTDWPNCTDQHFVAELQTHQMVEFVNRMITGLVSAIVALAVLGSVRRAPRRRDLTMLSWGLVAGVAGQVVVGKFVVETDLNPWVVQLHFVVSMLLVLDAVVLAHRAAIPDGAAERPVVTPALLAWGWALAAAAAVVVLAGTLVTGSGPHSGHFSEQVKTIKRLPIHPHDAARIHGLVVMAFLAIAVWVLVQLRRHQADERLVRRASALLTVLVLQGALGYTQYFTGVPPLLVGLHVFGACLVWVAALQVLLAMRSPVGSGSSGPAQSTGGPRTDLVSDGDLVTGR
ncbi:MAG: ctaA [Acidimicrobiales bacterium]|nr:ctaA [Acidimicrobiales bacterium]